MVIDSHRPYTSVRVRTPCVLRATGQHRGSSKVTWRETDTVSTGGLEGWDRGSESVLKGVRDCRDSRSESRDKREYLQRGYFLVCINGSESQTKSLLGQIIPGNDLEILLFRDTQILDNRPGLDLDVSIGLPFFFFHSISFFDTSFHQRSNSGETSESGRFDLIDEKM